jgi:CRP-like cAMP-binding protein
MIFDRAFSRLKVEEKEMFLDLAERQAFRDGEVIIEQGRLSARLYVIANGQVRVQQLVGVVREANVRLPDGTIRRARTPGRLAVDMLRLGSGAVLGEMSFVDEATTSARVSAIGDVEMLLIDGERIRRLIEENPGFGIRFYHSLAVVLSQRLRAANARARRQPGRSAERIPPPRVAARSGA